jgi:hypothetical protein
MHKTLSPCGGEVTTLIKILLLAAVSLCLTPPVSASKEGLIELSNFAVTANGTANSGPVRISGIQCGEGIANLKINVIGQQVVLNSIELSQIAGFKPN